MSNWEVSDRQGKKYTKVPWILSRVTAIFWGLLFWFLGRLHGMWTMYEGQFPLAMASVVGMAKTKLSVMQALLLAALDGAVAGWLLGWLLRFLLRRMPSN